LEVGPQHEDIEEFPDADISEADKEALVVYQHCWDDDKVDLDLVNQLLYHIVSTQSDGRSILLI
jgi:hypothetical protein